MIFLENNFECIKKYTQFLLMVLFIPNICMGVEKYQPLMEDFSATEFFPDKDNVHLWNDLNMKWGRYDMLWDTMEPQKGNFDINRRSDGRNNDFTFKYANEHGITLLPILLYTAQWASTKPDIRSDRVDGSYNPPKDPKDWANYVDRVVSHFTQSPYNVKYFQIWNEPNAEYWTGTYQEFVDNIYIPAAKIIHKYGGKVVFGGWAAVKPDDLPDLNTWLNYHNAWQYTDIVDIHYRGVDAWDYLYPLWIKNNKCEGLWVTEYGWNTTEYFIPNYIIPMAKWALEHQWIDKDKYRVFYFMMPDTPVNMNDLSDYLKKKDNYKKLLAIGDPLKLEHPQGEALRVLMNLYRGTLKDYNDPVQLEGAVEVYPMWAGKSLILYVKEPQPGTLNLHLAQLKPKMISRVKSVKKINVFNGDVTPLEFHQSESDGLVIATKTDSEKGIYFKIDFVK